MVSAHEKPVVVSQMPRCSATGRLGQCGHRPPDTKKAGQSDWTAPPETESDAPLLLFSRRLEGFGGGEAAFEICQDVIDVLDAHREADVARRDARLQLIFGG